VIDYYEWKTEKHHECTNMGKVKRLELSRDFQFGTLKISGRLIFVGTDGTMRILSLDIGTAIINIICEYDFKIHTDLFL